MNTLPHQIQILFPKIIQIEVHNLYEARDYYQLNGQFEAKMHFQMSTWVWLFLHFCLKVNFSDENLEPSTFLKFNYNNEM